MIRLKSLLTESININGVTLRAVNTQSGGPVEASWDGNSVQYKVEISIPLVYSGPVGITAVYKEDGKYFVSYGITVPRSLNRTTRLCIHGSQGNAINVN